MNKELFENAIKQFKLAAVEIELAEVNKKREVFVNYFTPEHIAKMPIEEYAIGRGNSLGPNFCYELEFKLKGLGSISGGYSTKFGVWYSPKKNTYLFTNQYTDAQTGFETIRQSILDLLDAGKKQDIEAIKQIPLDSLVKGKILSVYYPERYLNIYSKKYINYFLDQLGIEYGELSVEDKRELLINFKNGHSVMKDWNLQAFSKFLYSGYPGHPHFGEEKEEETSTQYWLYAAGEQANMWQDCLDNGIMSMGWDDLGDFKQYKSSTAIKDKIQEVYGKSNATNDTKSCWDFISGMREGDIVYVKKGMHKIIGQGVVMSDVYYDETREKHKNCRRVEWQHVGEWNIDKTQATLPMKTLTNITKYPDIVTLMEKLIQPQDEPTINYWWLTGSPKYWSPSKHWKLGENIDYTLRNEKGNPRRILKHFYEAKPGDIAITYESTPVLQVVAIGRVVAETDEKVLTIQKIEELSSPIPYAEILANPILKNSEPGLNRCQGSLFRLTKEEYEEAMRLIRINNPEPVEKSEIEMPIHTPYTNEDFLSEVYMAEESLNDLKNLLEIKKNVILQGAPGVGKTYSAKRLAYVMMGAKDDSCIKIIQFHQNYSYEDFIMGYKPNATGGFELKDGVFYDFCKKAALDPDNKYFFIIDEINRGNMSKIFGELLQLIEVDYRNHPIKLAYNNQDFAVPANVYIIGMMNTADRSLAMIDYALRRRFSFFTMAPAFELDSFKQHINNINDPKLNQLIDKVIELNKAIKNDSSLGEGFVIGHSYFCPDSLDLRTIVRYEILPTLNEYWFDNETIIQQWENELLDVIK